ncbi:MAG: type I methionyl aminopeptidase [Cyclobacteriaceae bacterium]|nr:type I methionyl aminopeptidase [Cyclobacteriaceae bacterium]
MAIIKTEEEIELMRRSAQMVSKTLAVVAEKIQPGVTPLDLDSLAEEYIRDHGGIPGFKGLYGFPNTLCTSINHQVVHGIPDEKPLEEGDIISVDCGVLMNGFYGDQAYTFMVGEVKEGVKYLLEVTKACLELGIQQAVAGKRIGDISQAIQNHAENHGFGVVRELVGHGLGRKMHESPEVPNYGKRGKGPKLVKGMTLAIEPMINQGTKNVKQLKDGWTIVTTDGRPSAHFEHDVVVRDNQAEILTTFEYIEEALNKVKI